MNQIYKYRVYDLETKQYLLIDGTLSDVTDLLGVTIRTVLVNSARRLKTLGRYYILRNNDELPENREVTDKVEQKPDPEFVKEWDRIRFILNPKARVIK